MSSRCCGCHSQRHRLYGQTTSPPSILANSPEVGSSLTADTIANLPLADNVYSLLETTQSEVISDRFNASGLNVGENSRAGGFLGSWSQTSFRIGDIDVTDPSGSGAPLLFPELIWWDRVTVATALMPTISTPRGSGSRSFRLPPGVTWNTTVRGSISGGGLASPTPGGSVPPIARLSDFGNASALASGPLIANRLGLVAGGSWARASKFIREVAPTAGSDLASGFAHLVYTPSPGVESRTLAWVQQTNVPFAYRQLFEPGRIHTRSSGPSAVRAGSPSGKPAMASRWRLYRAISRERHRRHIRHHSRSSHRRADPLDRCRDRRSIGRSMDTERPRAAQTGGQSEAPDRGRRKHRANIPAHIGSVHRQHRRIRGSHARAKMVLHAPGPGVAQPRHDNCPVCDRSNHPHASADGRCRHPLRVDRGSRRRRGFRRRLAHVAATGGSQMAIWQQGAVGGYRRSANRLNLDLLSFGDPNAETAIVTRFLPAPLAAAADHRSSRAGHRGQSNLQQHRSESEATLHG